MAGKLISLRDVAEAAGVSRMSASRALREGTKVSAELRGRVRAEAERLGYRGDRLVSEVMGSFAGGRAVGYRETFAVLWWRPWPALDTGGFDFAVEMRRGLHDGAELHGCRLDEVLIPERRAEAVLRRRLRARGIAGVIITPPPVAGMAAPELPWGEFSAVTLGSSLSRPALHRAQNHHYQAMERVLEEVAARGYERPVLLMQASVEERAHRAYMAAFLAWLGAKRAGDVHPDARDTDGGLAMWARARRADVVIAENDRLLNAVRGHAAAPCGAGWVSLDVTERAGEISGIFKDARRLGRVTVDLLAQARRRRETGLPEAATVLMTEGVWCEGATLRARQGSGALRKPVDFLRSCAPGKGLGRGAG
jgi:LacI family transcriptional regulator